ncbi:radical SAM domain-containing protein [Diaporthe sp. PMI_573]|nr:radical SAM domain-containing protein [Diaporthaceae sp. PMI_573]
MSGFGEMSVFRQYNTDITLIILLLAAVIHLAYRRVSRRPVPISVNYHFTRRCNKECGFCFHTAKTSHIATPEEAKRGLSLLKNAGMRKLNFAGGEPFLYPKYLGELVAFGKQVLELESVSIVSNGSLIKKSWLQQYGVHLDILAIPCDSFDEATNVKIGRGSGDNVEQLFRIRDWCRGYGIKFKRNTVVCRYNSDEDMTKRTLRDVRRFEIDDEEFELFCKRHEHLDCFVPESNKAMAESYLILDEYLQFLSGTNKGIKSRSITEDGVQSALKSIQWNQDEFRGRGGVYEWSKEELGSSGSSGGGGCGTYTEKGPDW